MYASNYFESQVLNLMRGQSISGFNTLYLGLFLSNPGDTGSEGTEISYTGYARQTIAFSAPAASGSGLMVQNTALISFPESSSSAGSVTYIGVFDSVTAGNMLLYAPLDIPLVVQNGVSPVFRAGSIKFSMTGNFSNYYRTQILNVLRGTNCVAFVPYLALCSGDPTASGTEFSGGDYARIAVTMGAPSQQASGTALSVNTNDAMSNVATANWGSLTHAAIYDSSTGGNPFAVVDLGRVYAAPIGTAIGIHAGDLQVNFN